MSEQITVVLPSVSTEGSLRTTARRAAMRCTPMASAMVTMAGKPSGIAPTASVMAKMTDSRRPVIRSTPPSDIARAVPTMRIATEITAMPTVSTMPILCSAMLSGVATAVVSPSMVLMRPSSVPLPVVVTTPRPVP